MPDDLTHPLVARCRMTGEFRCGIVSDDSAGTRVTIRAFGEIDILSAQQLKKRLRDARTTNPEAITLDLRGVTFIDSYGSRVLHEEAAASHADRFEIVASDCVWRLLKSTQPQRRWSPDEQHEGSPSGARLT